MAITLWEALIVKSVYFAGAAINAGLIKPTD